MTEPKDYKEYLERFSANKSITGYGIGNVYNHMPCPFCAAPDWLVFEILEVKDKIQEDTKCKECGRSAKAIVDDTGNGITFEVVQTGGPDQPDWLEPKMRRVK